jgi:hypothetical protein
MNQRNNFPGKLMLYRNSGLVMQAANQEGHWYREESRNVVTHMHVLHVDGRRIDLFRSRTCENRVLRRKLGLETEEEVTGHWKTA